MILLKKNYNKDLKALFCNNKNIVETKTFTKNGKHRTGYVRKKKTKKTQQTQYVETDEHPVQSKQISHSGVVPFGRMGISYLV